MSRGVLWRRFHLGAMVFWTVMVAPTVLWWHDSILWVAFLSIYALIATHWGAWQAARSETVHRRDH